MGALAAAGRMRSGFKDGGLAYGEMTARGAQVDVAYTSAPLASMFLLLAVYKAANFFLKRHGPAWTVLGVSAHVIKSGASNAALRHSSSRTSAWRRRAPLSSKHSPAMISKETSRTSRPTTLFRAQPRHTARTGRTRGSWRWLSPLGFL